MANIKSAQKRVQVSERNRQRNVVYRSSLRTAIKKLLAAVEGNAKKDELTGLLNAAFSTIDRAVVKGVLKKNTASRYKSRVAKAVQKSA